MALAYLINSWLLYAWVLIAFSYWMVTRRWFRAILYGLGMSVGLYFWTLILGNVWIFGVTDRFNLERGVSNLLGGIVCVAGWWFPLAFFLRRSGVEKKRAAVYGLVLACLLMAGMFLFARLFA
ncbi:MAG: hypothetical protein J6U40_06230 [Kiritimatiellae bacterium]|nr:hypothetical protein [Kiritimatiellia bacterium]